MCVDLGPSVLVISATVIAPIRGISAFVVNTTHGRAPTGGGNCTSHTSAWNTRQLPVGLSLIASAAI